MPDGYYYARINDPRTYQVIQSEIIQRRCSPFVVDFPIFSDAYKVSTFNKYISKDVRRHISSTISDRCVIGQQTDIGANTLIVNSVIGDGCKIADNVTIRDSIIWNGVTIKSGCTLEYNLVCNNVTIGEDVVLKSGVMLDTKVIVKPKAVLDSNTIGSCFAIMTNDKGQAVFKEVSEPNTKHFERGVVCFLPIEMELKKYQFIGQSAPYNDIDSDIEQSDDDSQAVEMTNRKFKDMIKEQMQQIFDKENSIDVALLNMRSWKHGYDGDHTIYLSAIVPSVLAQVLANTNAKTSKKAGFDTLKSELSSYKEIIRSFAQSTDEQEVLIQLIGVFCATNQFYNDFFSQTCQFLFVEKLLAGHSVLSWLKKAKKSATIVKKAPSESNSYGSDDEEDEIPIIESEQLARFVKSVSPLNLSCVIDARVREVPGGSDRDRRR